MEKVRLDTGMYIPLSGTPFESPRKAKRIICCDFDGTYLPFAAEDSHRSGIMGLEDFIDLYNDRLGMAVGWISGSSINAIVRKSEKHIRRLPHFIASSLGTEFYWVARDGLFPAIDWIRRIAESGFHLDELRRAVKEIKAHGIDLEPQHTDYQGQMMECHFYRPGDDMQKEVSLMKEICTAHRIKFVISGCNPAAGDPAGYYDTHFMPLTCGKAEAAAFAAETFGVDKKDIWAFGDSLNDMAMLTYASNSFLVANADPKAIERFGNVLDGEFCHGIRKKLSELVYN